MCITEAGGMVSAIPQKVSGVYLLQHPEAIAYLVFELPKSKI